MTYSLKNRPKRKYSSVRGIIEAKITVRKMEEWFEGFEKEFEEELSAFRGWLRVYRTELSKTALADYEDHLKRLEALGSS